MSMNSIRNVGGNVPVQPTVTKPVARPAGATAAVAARGADRLELTSGSPAVGGVNAQGIRADKVAAIRAQIEAGTYEDDHKIDVATNRLLDELTKG